MKILPVNNASFGKLHITKSGEIALRNLVKSTEAYNAMTETLEHIHITSAEQDMFLSAKGGYAGYKPNKNSYTTLAVKDNEDKTIAAVDVPRKISHRATAEKLRNLGQDYDKKMEISTNNNWLHEFDKIFELYK